jgi:hypothetical protein
MSEADSQSLSEVFCFTVGLDPVTERMVLMDCDPSLAELEARRADCAERNDVTYSRCFAADTPHVGVEVLTWLRQCGVAFSEAREMTVDLLHTIAKSVRAVFEGVTAESLYELLNEE